MKWFFIDSGENTGAFNMEYDMRLVGACTPDTVFVRFYRWQPYCISLGMYQKTESVLAKKAEHDGLEIVCRPTGGRAVLHAEELTYSVVMHTNHSFTPQAIYREINLALKQGLEFFNSAFSVSSLEHVQPDFRNAYKQPGGFACFATTAKNELKLDHKKLIGSAQRKIGDKILQHGSIICGPFHLRIADYLAIPDNELVAVKNELKEKTIDIAAITGKQVDYIELTNCMKKGFESHFAIQFLSESPV